MINTLFGIKKNMTSTYDSRGRRVGATVVEISPNLITQVKLSEGKDGYNAMQIGMGSKKSVKKPQIGLIKKLGLETKIRWFREVKIQDLSEARADALKPGTEMSKLSPGQEIKLDQVFSIGDSVKVSGISKGKGFQGGMRRHGFHGGSRTHGQSDRMRAPGAIGSGTTPGRVYKGKRMAGHMGSDTVSTKNLEVVGMDKAKNLLVIKGAIPGPTGGLIKVIKLGRIKGYTPPPEEKPSEEEEQEAAAINEQSAEQPQAEVVAVETPAEEVKENAS